MKIGILGYGTIGSGVTEVLKQKNAYNIETVKIFDIPQKREVIGDKYCDDFYAVCEDKSIDTIVEALGGNDLPYKAIKAALSNGKNVVTSNKEVVANHLKEFTEIAKEKGASFLFEASCGGGIPLIYPLIESAKINEIEKIYGIINGTTNFILSKMEKGVSFDEALLTAQKLGFAERDPSADLLGLDMVRKISILSDIAYDTFIDVTKVKNQGIYGITSEYIEKAKENGYKVKFLSYSEKKGNEIVINVAPVLLNKDSLIANTNEEFNNIVVIGKAQSKLSFYGKGAGKMPTASAIVGDLIKIAEGSYHFNQSLTKKYEIKSVGAEESYFVQTKDNQFKFTDDISGEDCLFYARILKE